MRRNPYSTFGNDGFFRRLGERTARGRPAGEQGRRPRAHARAPADATARTDEAAEIAGSVPARTAKTRGRARPRRSAVGAKAPKRTTLRKENVRGSRADVLAAREARALSLRRPQLLPRPSAGKGLPVAARARAAMLFFFAHALT